MTTIDLDTSVKAFGAERAAAAVVTRAGVVASSGDLASPFPLASVSKLFVAYAALIAVEEGTLAFAEPAGPPGSTVAHLLAHASGLPFERADGPAVAPGVFRIYSNAGFEVLAEHLEHRSGIATADYLSAGVFEPLGMSASALAGSPAYGVSSSVGDLARFAGELLSPRLIDGSTLTQATHVRFPGLSGELPGFGWMDPCDWGLGFELANHKRPHWTGERNSPETFGHFGRSGGFLWVDPRAELALVVVTDRAFGAWARDAWPDLSDEVLVAFEDDAG